MAAAPVEQGDTLLPRELSVFGDLTHRTGLTEEEIIAANPGRQMTPTVPGALMLPELGPVARTPDLR